MKYGRFYLLIGLIVLLLAAVLTLINTPELQKPRDVQPEEPDDRAPGEIVYRDRQHEVITQDEALIVLNQKSGRSCRVDTRGDRVTAVKRIQNKPAEQVPLLGTKLADGLKLTGTEQIHIVRTEPTVEQVAGFPHPHSSEDKIIISKETNTLFYYRQGEPAKTYRVATGKQPEYTPEGTFYIARKTPLPWSSGPEAVFGPRWMGLAVPCERDKRRKNDGRAPRGDKYGIHGTNEPDSIGTHASGGCIRLHNQDVIELYEMVEVGTTVEIVR